MSETDSEIEDSSRRLPERVFLVVVDESDEMGNALRFACRRAQHTQGRVALLYVIEPVEFQHWLGVGRMMEAEARAAAEQRVQALASQVFQLTGRMPVIHIREGERSDQLAALLQEEQGISLLVLATAKGGNNPGPLVTYLMSTLGRKIRIPVTLVPGELTPEEIDLVS